MFWVGPLPTLFLRLKNSCALQTRTQQLLWLVAFRLSLYVFCFGTFVDFYLVQDGGSGLSRFVHPHFPVSGSCIGFFVVKVFSSAVLSFANSVEVEDAWQAVGSSAKSWW